MLGVRNAPPQGYPSAALPLFIPHHGQGTDRTRTQYGRRSRGARDPTTDLARFGLRVGSWILVFWKRRAGEIACGNY